MARKTSGSLFGATTIVIIAISYFMFHPGTPAPTTPPASAPQNSTSQQPASTTDPAGTSTPPALSTPPESATSWTIPVGAGPQDPYTVQNQPPPGTCHYRWTAAGEPLPDPNCTPGATNPAVTQDTLATTICKSGYTADIRPGTSVTSKEKAANALSYNYTGALSDAEYDHHISLQLGGDPNDPRNLWVQPPSPGHVPGTGVNNNKDKVENKLKAAICSGTVTLVQAQQAIAYDWTTALAKLSLG